MEPWQILCIVIGALLLGNRLLTDQSETIRGILDPYQAYLRLLGGAFLVVAFVPVLAAIQ